MATTRTNQFTSGGFSTLESLLPKDQRDVLQQQNWSKFQLDIEKRLRIFRDDWEDILISHIKLTLSQETIDQYFPINVKPKWPIPIHMNLLKRVITEVSQVYNDNAKRAFIFSAEPKASTDLLMTEETTEDNVEIFDEDERYADIVNIGFNPKMQFVNKLTNLCNVVLVRPVPDPEKKFSQTGFRFDILTPDQFIPIQHPDDPSVLIGVMYAIDLVDTYNDTSSGINSVTRKELIFYMGTGEEGDEPFFAEVDNNTEEIVKQPYVWVHEGKPYLPFAIFRNEETLTGEFVNRTSGNDLAIGTLEAAKLLSRWIKAYESNSGKQLLVAGPGADKAPKQYQRDNMAIIQLPMSKEDATIENIDHQIDLERLYRSLEKFVEGIISNYNLSLEKFSAQAQSGFSLKLKNEGLKNRIQAQWESYRKSEQHLAEIVKRENNRALPTGEFGAIKEDSDFILDFGDLPFEPEPLERVQEFKELIEMGIKSKAAVLMIFEPDIKSIEDAQEKLMQNIRLNRETKTGTLPPTEALNQIAPVEQTEEVPNLLEEPESPTVDEFRQAAEERVEGETP